MDGKIGEFEGGEVPQTLRQLTEQIAKTAMVDDQVRHLQQRLIAMKLTA